MFYQVLNTVSDVDGMFKENFNGEIIFQLKGRLKRFLLQVKGLMQIIV